MHVDVGALVRWSARAVGVGVAAFYLLTLLRESITAAERGALSTLSSGAYLTLSLLWLGAIGLVAAIRWPFFGGFLTVTTASASAMLLVLQRQPLHPAVVLVVAAGALFVLDGSLRAAAASAASARSRSG